MDFGFLLLAVFFIYIVAGKRQDARRRKQRAPRQKQPEKMRKTEPTAGKTVSQGAKEFAADVAGFRARLRMAWGEKDTEAEPVRLQPEKEETPAPIRATVSASPAATVSSVSRVMGAAETERERLRAEAAKREKRSVPQKKKPVGAFDGESAEGAMRRWVRYDAVLGKPRSRKRWQSPVHKSC